MEYIEQSANAIRLYLVSGGYDIAKHFTVLAEAAAGWGSDYWIELDILGESHALTLYHGETPQFHEICACSDGKFSNPPLRSGFLHELPPHLETTVSTALTHHFKHERVSWTMGLERITMIQQQFDQAAKALCQVRYEFPVHEAHTIKPLTAVWATATTHELCVQSIHTYPNESLMVYTSSKIILMSGV